MKTIIILTLIIVWLESCNHQVEKSNSAAIVGDEIISIEMLDQLAKQEIYDEQRMIYTIRKYVLNNAIKESLLLQESKKYGISKDSLIRLNQLRQGHLISFNTFVKRRNIGAYIPNLERDLESIDTASVKGRHLLNKSYNAYLRQILFDSLMNAYNIEVLLKPPIRPRINILNESFIYYRGSMESNVTLIEISDFECGHCRENQELMKFLFNKYKNDVKFGYINYSSYASISALTSLAAAKQNKFWEMHDVLFNVGNLLSINEVYKLADSLNLDLRKFKSDIGSPRLLNDLELSFKSIRKLGVDATPSIIINGQLVYDSYSKEEIERVIIEELNK